LVGWLVLFLFYFYFLSTATMLLVKQAKQILQIL
jgi:hypothetical protein